MARAKEKEILTKDDVGTISVDGNGALTVADATATKEVVIIDQSLLLEDGAGEASFKKEDLAIPFLRVLQKGSPVANKQDPAYISPAEPGDFINTVTNQIWKGQDGVIIIPITYQRSHIEWIPRTKGGGFVKDWGEDDAILNSTVKDTNGRNLLPNGNEVVASGLYYILQVNPDGTCAPMAFPLQGSQWRKVRVWNTVMSTITAKDAQGNTFRPAKFYMSYKVTTVFEKNEKGDWMGVNIGINAPTLELPNGRDLYMAAREFKKVVSEGRVVLEHDEAEGKAGSKEDVPF